MKLHANARSCPKSRRLFIRRLQVEQPGESASGHVGVGPAGQLLLEFLGHRHDRRTCQSAEGAPEGRGRKNPEATYPATCLDNPAPRVNFTPPRGAH